jgi:hypothetical protein
MAAPAAATVVWCENPYYGNFNPGTRSSKATYSKKTKGLPSDEQFSANKKDAPSVWRFLVGKQAALEKVVSKYKSRLMPPVIPQCTPMCLPNTDPSHLNACSELHTNNSAMKLLLEIPSHLDHGQRTSLTKQMCPPTKLRSAIE